MLIIEIFLHSSEFSQQVCNEYMKFLNFEGYSIDEALRYVKAFFIQRSLDLLSEFKSVLKERMQYYLIDARLNLSFMIYIHIYNLFFYIFF